MFKSLSPTFALRGVHNHGYNIFILGILVRAGVTVYTCGKYCNETDVKPFQEIFSLCGHCEEVPEKSISALASIGGSGVAFVS